jgi:hypothetical protein
MPDIEVRGHSRFDRQASIFLRFCAGFLDFLIGAWIVAGIYRARGWDPALDWKLAPIFAGAILIPWLLIRWIVGASIGEHLWKTRGGKASFRETSDTIRATILTAVVFAVGCYAFDQKVLSHPYWSTQYPIFIDPPHESALASKDRRVLSFFYTLAPWPLKIGGKPVFYSIPYEVGPPKRFIGHIEADWLASTVRVSFEGPKTPIEFQSRAMNREEVHFCFTTSPWLTPSCVETRRLVLERHLSELRGLGYAQFEVAWFFTVNDGIPAAEGAQGVRLRARDGSRTQDRYILISPQGLHQSLAISYPESLEGLSARDSFLISLGALRISEDLSQGRAWTDRVLQSTQLNALPALSDPDYLEKLAQIQAVLVSKISIDPASFDPYYHLAGANLMLLKYCVKHPDTSLSALAQSMVDRMDLFAHDVSPRNPRLAELDRLLQDAKQF